MVYKELLESVSFSEIEPWLYKMYPSLKTSMGWMKVHYDMLRMIGSKRHTNADNGEITILLDEEDGETYLTAYSLEGEVWECALAKEIVIDKKVKASLPEIAASCLWHSSFYGFTPETEEECFRDMFGYDYCKELEYNRALIQKFGGVVPSFNQLPSKVKEKLREMATDEVFISKGNRSKHKQAFRKELMRLHYERMVVISNFIISFLSFRTLKETDISIKELCDMFFSTAFKTSIIPSYSPDEPDIDYLCNIIGQYNMIPQMSRLILLVVLDKDSLALDEKQKERLEGLLSCYHTKDCKILFVQNKSLKRQAAIYYAAFDL